MAPVDRSQRIAGLASLLFVVARLALAFVPLDLSNFQNEYVCPASNLIVRPGTVQDVQTAVRRYAFVRPNGAGHSWNRPFFCAAGSNATAAPPPVQASDEGGAASASATAVNVQLSTLRPLGIQVLPQESAVWVDAGVLTAHLLQFLADFTTIDAPAGYTLPAKPWYIYQTIGGAVATGTHGSSLTWGSLSNQVLELEMVLANGTVAHLTPERTPFLMRAARVSVGRLGVITRLKLRIVREAPVQRRVVQMRMRGFLALLQGAQAHLNATGQVPPELDGTEFFLQTQRAQVFMVTFTRGDGANLTQRAEVLRSGFEPDATTVYNTSLELLQAPGVSRLEDLPLLDSAEFLPPLGLSAAGDNATRRLLDDVVNAPLPRFPAPAAVGQSQDGNDENGVGPVAAAWTPPTPKAANALYGQEASVGPLMDANRAGVLVIARNATLESNRAYLSQPAALEPQIKGILYDQYEVAVPFAHVHECLEGLAKLMYGDDLDADLPATRAKDQGFRSAPLLRIVKEEDGLLALTGGGPALFLNLEDYGFYNRGPSRSTNAAFKAVIAHLRSDPACGRAGINGTGGRLHWGKAGWPDPGCWRGDVEYPDTWCDFGCAVRALDPTNKFAGAAPDRWTWEGVDLERCCTAPEGAFDVAKCQCRVAHARPVQDCGPAPWYTYR